jgi:hypothetical protein
MRSRPPLKTIPALTGPAEAKCRDQLPNPGVIGVTLLVVGAVKATMVALGK